MSLTAIIQARMASSRLPGKAVLPLDGVPIIKHNIRRAYSADIVDEVVIATTFHKRDDLIAEYAANEDAKVYRGSEDDVLGRLYEASQEFAGDIFIRLTGDNPLVDPKLIDAVGRSILLNQIDYASNKIRRTFPLGVDAEALTVESLATIHKETRDPYHREHATKYYRQNQSDFDIQNITVTDVYNEPITGLNPEIRLTLDEVEDYCLFRKIYSKVSYDRVLSIRDAVQFLMNNNLQKINNNVDQKTL